MTGLELRVLLTVIVWLGGAIPAAIAVHKVDTWRAQAAQTQALTAAVAEQKRQDALALDAAKREAAAQTALAADSRRQLAEAPRHVSITRIAPHCVPYGLVRVLVAAERGVGADSLPLPAGQSDDACTALEWPGLAAALIGDFGQARANAEQLDALARFLGR